MKKATILLSIIMLAGSLCYGQKCKYVKNEIDEFTNENNKITEAYLISLNTVSSNMYFINKGGKFSTAIFYANGAVVEKLNIGLTDSLMIKLDDNSILKLPPVKPIIHNEGDSSIFPEYFLTKEQIAQLSKNKIVKVRFFFDGNALDYDIEIKKAEKIMAAVNCVLL